MPVQTSPRPAATATVPPVSVNGTAPVNGTARPAPAAPRHPVLAALRLPAPIRGLHAGLLGGVLALAVLVIFIIQNAHVVQVSFLGIDVRLYMAVALLGTLIAGAVLMILLAGILLMTAAGTARIAQLRRAAARALTQLSAAAEPTS